MNPKSAPADAFQRSMELTTDLARAARIAAEWDAATSEWDATNPFFASDRQNPLLLPSGSLNVSRQHGEPSSSSNKPLEAGSSR